MLETQVGVGDWKIHVSKVPKLKKIENIVSELSKTYKIIQKLRLSKKLHEIEENWKIAGFFSLQESYVCSAMVMEMFV